MNISVKWQILTVLLLLIFGSISADNQVFVDYWVGTIRVMDTELEIHLEISESEGKYQGQISIPDQLAYDMELSDFILDYPEIAFTLDVGVPAKFQGSKKEGYISGTFSQAGVNGLFHVVRGDKSASRTDQIELGPLEGETEISVATSYGRLYGSLVLPFTGDNFPLVIIIAGSGPTDRDGNNHLIGGKGYVYRQLAEELREAGIATLRYDKRGVGKSSAALQREQDLRFDYFVQDVVHWVELVSGDERFSEIILFGHSQGSLLGTLAAQRTEVDGLISAAGAGRIIADVLIEQYSHHPEPYRSDSEEIIAALRQGRTVPDVGEELHSIFRPSIQPFLISWMRYDPSEEVGKLNIPVLVIHGTTDIQVSTEDAGKLAAANPQAELVIIDGMNHMFRNASDDMTENLRTYGKPDVPFSDNFIGSILSFVKGL